MVIPRYYLPYICCSSHLHSVAKYQKQKNCRLAETGKLFHSALTVPLYFTTATTAATTTTTSGRWGQQQQFMGVVVVYFRSPKGAASASALVSYASAVAKSAGPMSALMVRRARFVVGRAHRIKRNWRVLIIALRFALPMLVRFVSVRH